MGRYGEDWSTYLNPAANKKFCCVTELIARMHIETKQAYRGSPRENDYRIFHDHLSTMWGKGAIEYVKTLAFMKV